jgi:hypothetical protein
MASMLLSKCTVLNGENMYSTLVLKKPVALL